MATVTAPAGVRVLVIKRENGTQRAIQQVLESEGYIAEVAASLEAATADLQHNSYDAVVIDLEDFDVDAIRVLLGEHSRSTTQFITLTSHGNVEAGIEATRHGAFGYLARPFDADELIALVKRSLNKVANVPRRTKRPEAQRHQPTIWPGGMVGDSPPMRKLYQLMERVAPSRATVLITGETGTGKELVARGIHALSPRAGKPFVPINCSAWPESLLESELFGHVRGSFTGAFANRRGVFEEAHGGTLFLDEVSTIPTNVQIKLLRVLQEHEIRRLGSVKSLSVDFRLIVASNVDLAKEVEAGRFREDLYYRLKVFPIRVPPLRERSADIPQLIEHFYRLFTNENEMPIYDTAPEALFRMTSYEWPGNVRELEHFVERAVIMAARDGRPNLDAPLEDRDGPTQTLLGRARSGHWDLARLEREYILDVLHSSGGRRAAAAEQLGIDRRTLYRKLKEYGLHDLDAESSEADGS